MPIEEPSNADNLPKLLIAEDEVVYILSFPEQDIVKSKDAGPDEKWSCYRIEDLVVVTADKHESEIEEGTNEIPFWAMKPFFDAYKSIKKPKGEITFTYIRTEGRGGKNTCEIELDV